MENMTEVSNTDAGRKRRLPTWMLRVRSPVEQGNCENGDKTHSLLKDQPETQAAGYKTNPTIGKHCTRILTQDTDGSDKLDLLQRCEAKQRTRKESRRRSDPENSTFGEAKMKCKMEVDRGEKMLDDRDAPKKKKLKHNRSKNGDPEVPSPGKSEDETELTVEDLVSIAEEYINADKEKQHGNSIARESNSEKHPSSLSASSNVDAGRPLQVAGSGKILSKCTTARSGSFLTNTEWNKEKSTGVENLATNTRRTGDAAQDMLDLFLGPLLKKPPNNEQEIGAGKTESMIITNESIKQATSREMWREEATLTKKKSSLKDKVAMFLD